MQVRIRSVQKLISRSFVSVALMVSCQSIAFGLGSDHRSGDLPVTAQWTQAIYQALNQPFRIHGFWVNSTDVLFYEGSAEKLCKMLSELHKEIGDDLVVVIHPGRGQARSPWSTQPVGAADWSVTMSGDFTAQRAKAAQTGDNKQILPERGADPSKPIDLPIAADEVVRGWKEPACTVDIWLGTQLDPTKLDLPEGIDFRSGCGIDESIRLHHVVDPQAR